MPIVLPTRRNIMVLKELRRFFRICRWDRPKPQVSTLTLLASGGDGAIFRLSVGLGLCKCRLHFRLEQAPEVVGRQLDPEVLIRAEPLSLSTVKHASVPIQSFQVQQVLRQRSVP